MNKLFIALTLFIFASIGLNAQIYIGASVGNSFIDKNLEDVNGDDFTVDGNALGYKVFVGYGVKFLGIEGGYRDLGKAQSEIDLGILETHVTGIDVAARGKVHLGPIIAFAKAGAFFAKYENDVLGYKYSDENTTNFLWGLGAGLQLGRLGVRLEYEGLGKEDDKLSMLTAGLTYHFGKKEAEHETN
jgi:OmpA-OmpF porin, OOP family